MTMKALNHQKVLDLLPDRDPWGHKGDFGKLLLLCGSRGYTGAAYFAAMGALRSGAGLVFLGVPESIYESSGSGNSEIASQDGCGADWLWSWPV